MKNILRIKLLLALLLMALVPCVNAQVAHVGDILCTNGVYLNPAEYSSSGLEAMGVIFYVDATGQHGWIVALQNAGSLSWGPNSSIQTPLPDYNNVRAAIYDMDGLFNTQEVLNFGTSHNYTYSAFEALDVDNGWYVPAIGQLNYLYGNIIEVNTGLAACGGIQFDMAGSWTCWSSTEHDGSNAWCLVSNGKLNSITKSGIYYVRGVHNF